ncbi:MAG: HNH endonuclease [Chitinispirillales bacterium]|jgi:hypothetical protein|nr:HNH endonuclease [Chitinispirillales bacterium]
MKLDIQYTMGIITTIRSAIGAKSVDWSPDLTWNRFDPFGFLAKLDKYGEIEDLDLNDIDVSDDGTLEASGRKVIVYIRDRRKAYYERHGLPKFHIADCETLQRARDTNRFQKYVASIKLDGTFKVNIIPGHGNPKEMEVELAVCKNCLIRLNYKNYNKYDKPQREGIFHSFSIKEFFDQYKSTNVVSPKYNATTAPLNNYPADWDKIRAEQKRSKNYTCEQCHKNLKDNSHFLDVHHKNRRKNDNSPENLALLCIKCHSEQGDDHLHLKSNPRYAKFRR